MGILFLAALAALQQQPAPKYDLLIRGGMVLDGTGAPAFRADVAVKGDRIVAVSRTPLPSTSAGKVIDATGKVVSPGFIDLHAHNEAIFTMPDAESRVRQGVTTTLGGPDGGGPYPFAAYLDRVARLDLGINVAWQVGFGTIRQQVMGLSNRTPNATELAQMQSMVADAMLEGAYGLSTGLFYVPQTYAKTPEVIALAKVAAGYGGFYTSHLRKEGIGVLDGVAEAVRIAREAHIPVVLTHHKVIGKAMWGQSVKTLAMLDDARAAGLDVMADAYPYDASSTGFSALVPPWALADGDTAFARRVKDPVLRDSIIKGIVDLLENDRGGGDLHRVQFASVSWKPELNGKTLYDWAVQEEVPPTSKGAAPLVIQGMLKGGASMVYHVMDEGDVQRILKHRWVAIASDGALSKPGPTVPHPRNYGTFPRVLGRYVRELHVLTLPDAVRKMTSLPASRMRLTDRGRIAPQLMADLVVFNPDSVADKATYENPHQYPVGIDYVIVNGQVEVEDGKMTKARGGRILRHAPGLAPIAIVNVNLIPMDRERVVANQTVLLRGDRIVAVGPMDKIAIPKNAVHLDGKGKYLIPGLGEMHAHIPPAEAGDTEITRLLQLWALNGVTTIRGMLGEPRHLYFRALSRNSEILSPHIWTAGPSFNGTSVPSADSAVRMVMAEVAMGYDFLKIHPGVPRDAFDSIVATANRLKIRFAGHVPLAVGLSRAIEARYWSIDHLDGFMEALAKSGPPTTAAQDGFFGLPLITDVDSTRIPGIVAAIKAAGVWIVPTEGFFESTLIDEPLEALYDRQELRYISRPTALGWMKTTSDIRLDTTISRESRLRYIAMRRKLIKALEAGGVGIALGSDAPQLWNAPGFSVVRELKAYVTAGLTPYQALETATRNVARMLGNEVEAGTVAIGKHADLILLEDNPLKDIGNVSKKAGVVLGGRWLSKEEIARRLAALMVR